MNWRSILTAAALLIGASTLAPREARAELSLSQLVVQLQPGKHTREDIEVRNIGSELMYVAIDAREILNAGTPAESTRENPDPAQLGLLVSPARMVLEPGQRKLIRVAAIAAPGVQERVYRVRVKPVVGQLSSEQSGLKILIAYDVLVLSKPANPQPLVRGGRRGSVLVLRNDGNTSVELTDGKQCDESLKICEPLAGGRLYAGAEKTVAITPTRRALYVLKAPGVLSSKEF